MTRARHPLAARWHDGEATFGIWSCLPGTLPVEVFGRLGADYVCIDQQHGMHGPEDLLPLFQAVQLGGAAALTPAGSAEATFSGSHGGHGSPGRASGRGHLADGVEA